MSKGNACSFFLWLFKSRLKESASVPHHFENSVPQRRQLGYPWVLGARAQGPRTGVKQTALLGLQHLVAQWINVA